MLKVHNVQHLIVLPHPHSGGVNRLCGLMAAIATTSLLSLLSQIRHPAHSSGGPTAVLCGNCVCACRHLAGRHRPFQPTSYELWKHNTVCYTLPSFTTCLTVTTLHRTHRQNISIIWLNALGTQPNSPRRVFIQRLPKLFPTCSSHSFLTCTVNVLLVCHNLVSP